MQPPIKKYTSRPIIDWLVSDGAVTMVEMAMVEVVDCLMASVI
jgi:hypothetical protein